MDVVLRHLRWHDKLLVRVSVILLLPVLGQRYRGCLTNFIRLPSGFGSVERRVLPPLFPNCTFFVRILLDSKDSLLGRHP